MKNGKSSVNRIARRIKKLERIFEEFDEDLKKLYVENILKQYTPLINSLCSRSCRQLGLNFINEEDLRQEFFEYLLRWTYCEVRRRFFSGDDRDIWIPLLKRSFANFIINLQKKYKRGGKRRPLMDVVSLSLVGEETQHLAAVGGLEKWVELKNYILEFYSNLESECDRKVFQILFDPPPQFTIFNYQNNKKLRKFDIIAKYLGISYNAAVTSHNYIRKHFNP